MAGKISAPGRMLVRRRQQGLAYHEADELPDDVGEALETLTMRVVREDRSAG